MTILLHALYLGLLWKYWPNTPPLKEDPTSIPSYDVLICGKNEAHHWPELIRALTQLQPPPQQIIAVDDQSEDPSFEILKALKLFHSNLVLLQTEVEAKVHFSGKRAAIHTGIGALRSEWVLLTDADCLPADSRWPQQLIGLNNIHTAGAILGLGLVKGVKQPWGWMQELDAVVTARQYMAAAHAGMAYMGVGRNMAIRREFIEAYRKSMSNGKFSAGGDDDELVQWLSQHTKVIPNTRKEAATMTDAPATFVAWYRQKWRHKRAGWAYPLKWKVAITSVGGANLWVQLIPLWIAMGYLSLFWMIPYLFFQGWQFYSMPMYLFQHPLRKRVLSILLFDFIYSLILGTLGIVSSLKPGKWK